MTTRLAFPNTWWLWPLLLLGLAGCSSSATERLWLKTPGWSRAQLVGLTRVADPASFALDDSGTIYLLTVTADDQEQLYPEVTAFDRQMATLWQHQLDVPLERPDIPQILWDGQALRLFWIDNNRLYAGRLDSQGTMLGPAELLSGEVTVADYAAAAGDGRLAVWYAGPRREPGLYALNPDGPAGDTELVDPQGTRPALRYDRFGRLHALYAHYPPGASTVALLYAMYEDGRFERGQQQQVLETALAPSSILAGPTLGLDQQNAYLFWSIQVRTGMEAGAATTRYVTFPMGQPNLATAPIRIDVPTNPKSTIETDLNATVGSASRVSIVPGETFGTSSLNGLATNPVPEPELAVAFQSPVDYLYRKTAVQVSTMYLQGGGLTGYQLLSYTGPVSLEPAIQSDANRQLYLTWLQPAEAGFNIYLTSTAADIQANLRAPTSKDLLGLTGNTLFGLVTGALLAPIAGTVWVILPLLIIGLTSPLRKGEQRLISPATLISLGIAVAVFLGIKYFSLPGLREYVPFSAWLPLPEWLQGILQFLVPVSITLLALVVAWYFTYRRETKSPVYFMLIFAAADAVMTMAIYGVLIYGGF